MASSSSAAAADEDDEFVEYNPHPYQGGYDIALTYGPPLPPSPAICYPPSSLPPPQPDPISVAPVPEPEPPALADSGHQEPDPISVAPVPEPEPPALADSGHQEPDPSETPFNFWPYPSPIDVDSSCRCDLINDSEDWSRLFRRAANFLFGYSQGYGEKWAGVDTYGIPIYAYKKHEEQPVVVEVEPAQTGRLDYYEDQCHSQDWQLARSERYGDYGENDVRDQEYLVEPLWYQTPSYSEVSKDEVPLLPWQPSSYYESGHESLLYGTPNYAYNRNHYEVPFSVQVDPLEMASTHTVSYHENDQEYVSSKAKLYPTSNSESLEPFEPSWSRSPSYYGLYEEETPYGYNGDYSLNGEKMDESLVLGNPSYDYQTSYNDQSFPTQLEPFKPAWLQNSIIYEAYEEGLFPNSQVNYVDYDE